MNTAVGTPILLPAPLEVCGSPWFTGFFDNPKIAEGFQPRVKMTGNSTPQILEDRKGLNVKTQNPGEFI